MTDDDGTTITPKPTRDETSDYLVRFSSGIEVRVPNRGGTAKAYAVDALARRRDEDESDQTDEWRAYRAVSEALPWE